MASKLLLVDFENIQQLDLTRLDKGCRIVIFVGPAQKTVPINLVASSQPLGDRVEWQRVNAAGHNALDFFIACKLGCVMESSPHLECAILSKDKGFDPLLQHLNNAGLKCQRINSMTELEAWGATQSDEMKDNEPKYKRLVEVLSKCEKKSRPRKRKTLAKYISAIFQEKLAAAEIDRLIDSLFAKGLINETDNAITYEF